VWFELGRPRRSRRLSAIARTLLLMAAITPLLVPLFERFEPTHAMGVVLRRAYGFQCHQRAARTLALGGVALPICARCLGIYLGLGLAALVGRPRLRADPFKAWILIGSVVMAVDVATEWVGLRPPSAWFRAATGALLAYGIALAILLTLRRRRG
jgi:uncharacterized membrane protein